MNQACQLFLGAPTGITKLTGAYMIHRFFELNFKNTAKNTVITKNVLCFRVAVDPEHEHVHVQWF